MRYQVPISHNQEPRSVSGSLILISNGAPDSLFFFRDFLFKSSQFLLRFKVVRNSRLEMDGGRKRTSFSLKFRSSRRCI